MKGELIIEISCVVIRVERAFRMPNTRSCLPVSNGSRFIQMQFDVGMPNTTPSHNT